LNIDSPGKGHEIMVVRIAILGHMANAGRQCYPLTYPGQAGSFEVFIDALRELAYEIEHGPHSRALWAEDNAQRTLKDVVASAA